MVPRRAGLLLVAAVAALLGWQAWQSPALRQAAAGLLSLCGGP